LIVNVNVAVFVQPEAFIDVNVYVPLVVYVEPFHVYESQAVTVELSLVEPLLIVNVNVAVLVQPAAFIDVNVYVPLIVYVEPFHVYESQAVTVALPLVEL